METAMRNAIASAGADAPVAGGAANLLCLAATPVFAVMALVTRDADMAGMPGMTASPLNGMALMYLLMALFHASPWLTWIARRRSSLQTRS
jgi:hypothetical protein